MIAFTILRLRSFSVQTLSDDPTLSGVLFFIWFVVEVEFSICSGNISCLQPFMAAFNTSYEGSTEIYTLFNMVRSEGEPDSMATSTMGAQRIHHSPVSQPTIFFDDSLENQCRNEHCKSFCFR
jgi:hypothetical protein